MAKALQPGAPLLPRGRTFLMTGASAPPRQSRWNVLPLFALPFPAIDPVLISIGPFAIRWYALAYIVGIVAGWWLGKRLCAKPPMAATPQQADDFVT